jgi:hypothetical protein
MSIAAAQTGDLYYLFPVDFTTSVDGGVLEVSATCGAAPGWLRLDGDRITAEVPGITVAQVADSPRPKYSISLDLSSCRVPRLELTRKD